MTAAERKRRQRARRRQDQPEFDPTSTAADLASWCAPEAPQNVPNRKNFATLRKPMQEFSVEWWPVTAPRPIAPIRNAGACLATLRQSPELFGCYPEAPLARYDRERLLRPIDGRQLIALTAETAVIESCTGARLTYRRKPIHASRRVGARLYFLPPYRPALNPIEQLFAKLKTLLRNRAAAPSRPLGDASASSSAASLPRNAPIILQMPGARQRGTIML